MREEADKVMNEKDKDTVLPFCGAARWAGRPVNLGEMFRIAMSSRGPRAVSNINNRNGC